MALIGYARVSTLEQNLDLQRLALKEAKCIEIFEDIGYSATAKSRPGFDQALARLCPGDVLVVWKMDRAFRSLRNALDVSDYFEQRNIELRCLTEAIDTTTPMGKCMYQIRNVFAELERNFIRERTVAGMHAARARGVHVGRPRKLSSDQIRFAMDRLRSQPRVGSECVARELGVSPSTLTRSISRYERESLS